MPAPRQRRLAFSTNAFKKNSLEQAIDFIADIGYGGVELMADLHHAYPPIMTAQRTAQIKGLLAELKLAEIPSILALNKADLVAADSVEAAVRQARQLDSGETVVISAIKPSTLDALLQKAGAVLARNLAAA